MFSLYDVTTQFMHQAGIPCGEKRLVVNEAIVECDGNDKDMCSCLLFVMTL